MGIENEKTDLSAPRSSAYYSAEFDIHPRSVGKVELLENDYNEDRLVVRIGEREIVVVEGDRDQWGVYLTVGGITIAQEDKTRSFLDALVGGLKVMRDRNEHDTKPATVAE